MHTIVVKNVPDEEICMLIDDPAKRKISLNDLLLELITAYVQRYLQVKSQQEATFG